MVSAHGIKVGVAVRMDALAIASRKTAALIGSSPVRKPQEWVRHPARTRVNRSPVDVEHVAAVIRRMRARAQPALGRVIILGHDQARTDRAIVPHRGSA